MPTIQVNFKPVGEANVSIADMLGIKGTMTSEDLKILSTFSENLLSDGGKYVETGSYLGFSAIVIAFTSKADLIYAHDLWESTLSGPNFIPELEYPDYFFKFYQNVKDHKFENRIIPIRGDSKYTLGIHDDKSIDLAFIDGDHSYLGVFGDLEAILPKMKPGGVILCHDCTHMSATFAGANDFVNKYGLKIKVFDNTTGMAMIKC